MTNVLTPKDKTMELVKFVTINVELVKMLTLVFLVPSTLTELPPQIVHVLMDIMITELPNVPHVPTDVPPVTQLITVLLVLPEESTPQLVIVQPENSITDLIVLLVAINVMPVLNPLVTVLFVTNKELPDLNQLVHVQKVLMNLMETVQYVNGIVPLVFPPLKIVSPVLKTESMPLLVSVHQEPPITMNLLTAQLVNITV